MPVRGNRADTQIAVAAGFGNNELATLVNFDRPIEGRANAHECFGKFRLAVAAYAGDAVDLTAAHCEAQIGNCDVPVGACALELYDVETQRAGLT